MGFYDDEYTSQKKNKSGGTLGTWIAVSLVSALIGSGTTIALVPALVKSNVIETNQEAAAVTTTTSGGSNKVTGDVVNVSVQTGITEAVNKVKPAVVGVRNLQETADFFGRSSGEQEAGTGSGVLIDAKGYIVTNNHVVEDAKNVEITLSTGKNIKAEIVGMDVLTDLAVLKVNPDDVKDIAPVKLGASEGLNIGEPAIAIGNPLGAKFANTVTVGVISALNRELPLRDGNGQEYFTLNVLQTDAAINPGNSGGALINISGELVGINSAKIATQGVEGIGFAIPIDEARPIVNQLIEKGKIERPRLGVTPYNLSEISEARRLDIPVDKGVIIGSVEGNAAKAGLQRGDVIVKIDGQAVEDQISLRKVLYKKQPGDTVKVEYYRGKELKTADVQLSTLQ